MASAEQLLNEAQYAFNSVGPGGNRNDRRNASRASRLARKIIRKYPTTTEAAVAHSLLRRLGEEAFLPKLPLVHKHAEHSQSHRTPEPGQVAMPTLTSADRVSTSTGAHYENEVSLDWRGLLSLLLATPKVALGILLLIALFLFGIFGWFMVLPLLLLVFLTSPARALLQRKQRDDVNAFVVQANAWIDRKIQEGKGLG